MRMKSLFSLVIGLALSFGAFAQARKVTGAVTSSADGTALQGVSVSVKGTKTGVTTDANGNYAVDVDGKATLVFSYVGFLAQELSVGNRSVSWQPFGTKRIAFGR